MIKPIRWKLLLGRCSSTAFLFGLGMCASLHAQINTVTDIKDPSAAIGRFASMVLDTSGNPVIGHFDETFNRLIVTTCSDVGCNQSESSVVADLGSPGQYAATAIGNDGFPIIGFHHDAMLKVAKCHDFACRNPAPTISVVDTSDGSGQEVSIAIGADALPIMAYHNFLEGDLKVVKCNDPSCSGEDESISIVENGVDTGRFTSLVIGPAGFPIISYLDADAGEIKAVHCNDTACAGGDETISPVDDLGGNTGYQTSIQIGFDDLPVVAYGVGNPGFTDGELRVLKCDDLACAGGGEVITTIDDEGFVGLFASMDIGADQFPVIAYYDVSNDSLKSAKCSNMGCTGGITISQVHDDGSSVGQFVSLKVADDGFPVISYREDDLGDLLVTRCNDASCSGQDESINRVVGPYLLGQFTSIAINSSGMPGISFYSTQHFLKFAQCGDVACAGGAATLSLVDGLSENVGAWSSLGYGLDGFPTMSYYDLDNQRLKVAKCDDPACGGGGEFVSVVGMNAGANSSLAIGAEGFPVIAHDNGAAFESLFAKCNDAACAGGDETINTLAANRFEPSVVVAGDGLPVLSLERFGVSAEDITVEVIKCNDPGCSGGNESIVELGDGTPGFGTVGNSSITLGNNGFPVVSYSTAGVIRLARCATANCSSFSVNDVFEEPSAVKGFENSVAVDGSDLPIISHWNEELQVLRVSKCLDNACASAVTTNVDEKHVNSGQWNAITIGADNLPIMSYHDPGGFMKVLHCGAPDCRERELFRLEVQLTRTSNVSGMIGDIEFALSGTSNVTTSCDVDSTLGHEDEVPAIATCTYELVPVEIGDLIWTSTQCEDQANNSVGYPFSLQVGTPITCFVTLGPDPDLILKDGWESE